MTLAVSSPSRQPWHVLREVRDGMILTACGLWLQAPAPTKTPPPTYGLCQQCARLHSLPAECGCPWCQKARS